MATHFRLIGRWDGQERAANGARPPAEAERPQSAEEREALEEELERLLGEAELIDWELRDTNRCDEEGRRLTPVEYHRWRRQRELDLIEVKRRIREARRKLRRAMGVEGEPNGEWRLEHLLAGFGTPLIAKVLLNRLSEASYPTAADEELKGALVRFLGEAAV